MPVLLLGEALNFGIDIATIGWDDQDVIDMNGMQMGNCSFRGG